MFAVKLLLVLGSITVLFLRGEAAQAVCGKLASIPTIIQTLPGKPGSSGAPGEPGLKGERGADGRNGSDGAPGLQGPVGPVGPLGMMGMNGTDGEQGPMGIPGVDGRDGVDGRNGSDGAPGLQGPVGPVGPQRMMGMNGTDGEQGPMGLPGVDGRDGVDGRNGSDGSPGPPGTVPDAVIEQLKAEILDTVRRVFNLPCPGDREENPASSCKEIHECNQMAPSAYYWVNGGTGPVQVYCVMEINNCGNITGGWMRAAYIDMTNVSNTCPQGLTYTVASSTRMCTRSHSGWVDCSSVTFPTHGVPYTKVCSGYPTTQWYLADPLWDSQGCASGSTCCNRGGPWFTTTLSQEASDDIELRMCHYWPSGTEDVGLEQLEILIN